MPLTLANVLELDLLRLAEAEVLAGADGLSRPVRWVHISEQPDIARYLKGGELLLTTGMGLGLNETLQSRYVGELAEVGIAGLMIRLGGTWKVAPERLISEARKRELPLIALHRRIGFIELTEQIHGAIINRQLELLTKAESIGKTFNELVMRGADLARILDELARIVQNPVVFEDAARQLVEFAPHGDPADALLALWETQSRGAPGESASLEPISESPSGVWIDILLRDERWGRLHVLALDRRLDEIDALALDRAAAAVALTLLNEAERSRLTDHARESLIADILGDSYGGEKEFFRRAVNCRADFRDRRLVATVLVPQGLSTLVADDGSESDRARLRRTVLLEMQQAADALEAVALCCLDGDNVLSIIGLDPSREVRSAADKLARQACRRLTAAGHLVPVIGVSAEASPKTLRRAFDQAAEAADYASGRAVGGSSVVHFADLGLQHLLLRLNEGPELARFVEEELGTLLEYDARHRTLLVLTLRAYLDCGCRKSRAARALSIQRRSLYHRLDRIEAILAVDLEDEEASLRLRLALRGLELLRLRSPVGMSRTLLSDSTA